MASTDTANSQQSPPAPSELPRGTLSGDTQTLGERITIGVFIAVPFVALVAAIPVAWMGGYLSWLDVVLAVAFYAFTATGSPSASTGTSRTVPSRRTAR